MAQPRRSASRGDPIERIRQLAALLDEYRLTAIAASWDDVRVTLARSPRPRDTAPDRPHASDRPAASELAAPAPSPPPTTTVTIEAPMVGTFYRASSPGADPYVKEGDAIKTGQVLCIIEAMKLMNEIESKIDGRVVKILVDNGVAVEYGQALFHLEPRR